MPSIISMSLATMSSKEEAWALSCSEADAAACALAAFCWVVLSICDTAVFTWLTPRACSPVAVAISATRSVFSGAVWGGPFAYPLHLK